MGIKHGGDCCGNGRHLPALLLNISSESMGLIVRYVVCEVNCGGAMLI